MSHRTGDIVLILAIPLDLRQFEDINLYRETHMRHWEALTISSHDFHHSHGLEDNSQWIGISIQFCYREGVQCPGYNPIISSLQYPR